MTPPRRAVLVLDGWEGRSETPVLVVGYTPKRWRIKAIERTRLAGRHRWLEAGAVALVPTRAVRFSPEGRSGPSP